MYAVSEFADRLWELEATNGLAADDRWIWGIINSVFAVALVAAAVSVLRGGAFGAIVGVAWAAIDAMAVLGPGPSAAQRDRDRDLCAHSHYDWSATATRRRPAARKS